jgi:hypothetical protein
VREPITIMVGHSAHQQCRAGQSSVQNTFVPGLPGTQAVWGTEPCMEPGIQAGPRRPECRSHVSTTYRQKQVPCPLCPVPVRSYNQACCGLQSCTEAGRPAIRQITPQVTPLPHTHPNKPM